MSDLTVEQLAEVRSAYEAVVTFEGYEPEEPGYYDWEVRGEVELAKWWKFWDVQPHWSDGDSRTFADTEHHARFIALAHNAMPSLLEMAGRALRVCDYCEKPLGGAGDNVCPACLGAELRRTDAAVARAEAAEADYEKARGVLLDALRNQGLLQNTATRGVVWHAHDCPASFDFAECNYRCRVAREAFALAGTEPYEVPPPCDCTPGDTCTCATDCDCRERDAHIWKYDAGWRNIEGLEETRRDTEVYE